jgi:hypothetical protein
MRKLGDLKVPELHDELAKVGLSKKGKKAELVEVIKKKLNYRIWRSIKSNKMQEQIYFGPNMSCF